VAHVTDIASALAFLCFLALAVVVAARGADLAGRYAVRVLILFVIAASTGAAITRHDFWPFSHWRMMPTVAPATVGPDGAHRLRLVGVTAAGVEYRVDPRAWEPLSDDELSTWLYDRFPRLPPQFQARVGAHLLAAANAGRAATRAGGSPGYFARVFGPLTAPSHYLHARFWTRPEDVPAEPFMELRLYVEQWGIEARREGRTDVHLKLVYRYRHAP
jgi:hypothetical protein